MKRAPAAAPTRQSFEPIRATWLRADVSDGSEEAQAAFAEAKRAAWAGRVNFARAAAAFAESASGDPRLAPTVSAARLDAGAVR